MDASHPSRGAWIEIHEQVFERVDDQSHPSRGAWIEIPPTSQHESLAAPSHPSRGAWIEI